MEIGDSIKNLTNRLGRGKTKILNIALIILTVIIAPNVYKSNARSIASLNIRKDTESKKNGVLGEISQSEKMIKFYKNLFNKKDASLVINTINNIARDSNVKIISIKPGAEEQEPVYTRFPFVLTVSADSYHGIGKFISKIENHPDVYFVDAISIKTQEVSREQDRESGLGLKAANRVIVNLTLSIIIFKG